MHLLIYFFRKYRYFLFFLILQVIALFLTINNHSFHKSKFISSANGLTGGVYNKISSLTDYLNLRTENDRLLQENLHLREQLLKTESLIDSTGTLFQNNQSYNQKFQFIQGRVINNQYNNSFNFLTLNLGSKDSIEPEMAVFNSKGVLGIIDAVGNNYSRVASIINRDITINARPKKDARHFGSLSWDGIHFNVVQLEDIPRQVDLQIGDTIITGGKSAIFPEGILIGAVKSIDNPNTASKVIHVELFNDMSSLRNVYVVRNFHKKEIKEIESITNE